MPRLFSLWRRQRFSQRGAAILQAKRHRSRRQAPLQRVFDALIERLHGQQLPAPLPAATLLITVLALILGGGTDEGVWSETIIQLGSLVLLVIAVLHLGRTTRLGSAGIAIAVAAVAIPILQLLPLPYELWALLPARGLMVETFGAAGIAPAWLPFSLNPTGTERALYTLLPPIAVFLATLSLDWSKRWTLARLIIGFSLVTVFLGLLQLMQGPASPLRLHAITNTGSSVGFFANRNHYAALLFVAIPLVAAQGITSYRNHPQSWLFRLAVYACLLAALILGIGMSHSRAGAVLAMVAIVAAAAMIGGTVTRAGSDRGHWFLMGGGLIGATLVIQFALAGLLARFQSSTAEDARWEYFSTTWQAAKSFLPFGSGLGSFVEVYTFFERPGALVATYANHAHNDWLELLLETGLPGIVVLVIFLVWLGRAGVAAWRSPAGNHGRHGYLMRAASVSIVLLLLHSMVDYPLRATALATLFAMLAGFLVEPPPQRAPRQPVSAPAQLPSQYQHSRPRP